jgi:hypothetical protein
MQVLLPQACRNILGLGSSAFARHYSRNHCCFLLLWVLRCFSSPRSPILRYTTLVVGCPIRISTDQIALANPRSFSQLITSFLASESLGIPRAPLFTYLLLHSRVESLQSLLQYVNELYSPDANGVEDNGFEPLTPCVQGRCSSQLS